MTRRREDKAHKTNLTPPRCSGIPVPSLKSECSCIAIDFLMNVGDEYLNTYFRERSNTLKLKS
jgi:hypothetical protein